MTYFDELLKISEPVRKQFEPSSRIDYGLEDIPFGSVDERLRHKEPSKGLEQVYPERLVMRVTNNCPYVCSYCFEAPKINNKRYSISQKDIDAATSLISANKKLNYVSISGGTPFVIGAEKLYKIISEIYKIEHIKQIYVAGSRPIFEPGLWSKEIAEMLASFNNPDFQNPEKSKIIGVSSHINHPDELKKIPSGFEKNILHALYEFTSRGIPVYCYSTLLKGVNNDAEVLKELFLLLRQQNVTPRYLIHAMNTPWKKDVRVPLEEMIELAKEIEPLSGNVKPIFIAATPIGKVHIHSTMKLEYKLINGVKHVKLKTPYNEESFRNTNRLRTLPPNVEVDDDKRLIIYYPDEK